jgi:hypothetical protein
MRAALIILVLIGGVSACGPAAETQSHMKEQARHLSDSITRALDSALNDPVKEFSSGLAAMGYTPVSQPK